MQDLLFFFFLFTHSETSNYSVIQHVLYTAAILEFNSGCRCFCFWRRLSSFNALVFLFDCGGKYLLVLLSFCSNEDWNQMQSQEEDTAITEQDLELIKERETAIRQLEVSSKSCLHFQPSSAVRPKQNIL